MKKYSLLLLALGALLARADEKDGKPFPLGYTDTPPIFAGSKWKVHDLDRPGPRAVRPGDKPGAAPADAIVIFDGKNTTAFAGKDGMPCPWKFEHGELIVDGGDVWSKESFASCQFLIEWKSDPKTYGNSQKKGNAGVFFMDRYECQILDCTDNPTYADGMAGAVYGQTPPLVNAVRKAGEWQTYDILFTAPKVANGKVIEPAYITTIINGIVVQNHTAILGPTVHKKATDYEGLNLADWKKGTQAHTEMFPATAPFRFQDHKNTIPDRFRNIWVRPL